MKFFFVKDMLKYAGEDYYVIDLDQGKILPKDCIHDEFGYLFEGTPKELLSENRSLIVLFIELVL